MPSGVNETVPVAGPHRDGCITHTDGADGIAFIVTTICARELSQATPFVVIVWLT